MAYITKKKLAEIINNAPNNVDRTKLLSELVKRGNILEGYNEKKTGFLTNVARDIVSPFAKGAELLKTAAPAYGSVIKAGFQQLTGNKEKAQQTLKSAGEKLQQDRQDTIGVFGQGVSTIKNKKQAVGSALEIGSNFIGGAGAKSALTGLKTPLRTVVKDLAVSGAKTGLGAGTLYGAGNALNNDKNVLGGAITGGAGGAIGGAILSPVLGVAGRAVTQTVPAIRTKLLSSSEKRLVNVAQDLTKMTPTAIKKESAWSKNTPKFLVKERVLPLINSENGKIKADDAISALRAKSQLENTAFKNILKDSGKQVSLDEYGNRLKQELTEDLRNRGADLDNAVAKVDKEIEAYKKNYANKITDVDGQSYIDVTDFNDIKSGLWQKSSVSRRVPGAELDADIFYQMGHGAKELIEEVIDDAEVAKLNGRLGDFAQAIKVLETANGKVLPGGMLGKGLTRIAGSIAGAAGGGLPGSIIGNITGGVLADILNNPKTRTTLLSKVYNRLQKEGKLMSVIEEAQKIAEKRGLERASRKLLESPKTIFASAKSDTSRLFTQEEAQILLDSYKVKEAPKLLKAPGQNPILLPAKSQTSKELIQNKQVKEGITIEDVSNKLDPKNFKTAEDYVKAHSLYHGTPNELEGGVLKFGAGKQLKKGGYMGGHFLTDTPEIAQNFSFGGKVYQASGEIKNKVLDVNKNKKLFQDYIGKEYLSDGEKLKFTQQDFDSMFPNGKADWATINTDLVEQLSKKLGKIGVAIPEYAGGKQGMTYQLFQDNIPVKTKSQLISEWNKAQKLKSNPLIQEAKKYKTTVNINDKNDLEYLGRILSQDQIKDIKSGKMTNFRGTPYEDLARVNIVSEKPKTIAQQLEGKIKPVKLKDNILYHGTSPDVVDSIFAQGFKKGSELPKDAFRSGGYDQIQNSISLTTSPKIAEIFSGIGKNVSVIKTKLADNAKIVKIEGIQDAVDLEDYISYLTKNKIDAVWIGGGEKELVVLNSKKLIPIDSITKSVYKGK